jgi:hypothetical protein
MWKSAFGFLVYVLSASSGAAHADDRNEDRRQSLDDAWWTGPLLAAGAATLPKGHVLFEPYFFDIDTYAHFDLSGNRSDIADRHYLGSQSYLLYGLVDDFTVGLIPRFGFNDVPSGRDSSGVRVGDLTLQAQYLLTRFHPGSRMPTTSIVLQETLPLGEFDRLGDRPSNGVGGGAYATTVELHSQTYFWMPNGRILRSRLNLSYTKSNSANLQDVSVYGTPDGFRGDARPGDSYNVTAAWEYSATQQWVLALDVFYQHDGDTRVRGNVTDDFGARTSFLADSGSGHQIGTAPAVEYNWSPQAGVIAGFRWIFAGANASASLAPVVAINLVY